jgi:transmembrane sensor
MLSWIKKLASIMQDRFLYLVKQQLAKRISAAENRELQDLLASREDLRAIYQAAFSDDYTAPDNGLLESEQSYAAHSVRMHLAGAFADEQEPESSAIAPVSSRRKLYLIAASCVLLVVAVKLFFPLNSTSAQAAQKSQVNTRKGSKSHIVLPDGTSVWLNGDSKISYPASFQGEIREVSLTGEAFFDVAANPRKPFIIHTGSMDVKVLGTVFNVRSYPGEMTTETSLLHGLIEVTLNGKEKKKIILKPNEKITVLNSDESYQKTSLNGSRKAAQEEEDIPLLTITKMHFSAKDSTNPETSWVHNKLSFDNEKMDRVFSKIEQWYNIEIKLEDDSMQLKHFTATFENKSLKDVMEALALALNFTYAEKNGKITIK